jgi:ribosomal protein S18 acetylase RimI-like enzyme
MAAKEPKLPELPKGLHLRRPALEDAEPVAELMCATDIEEMGHAETDANDVRDEWSQPRFDRDKDAWIVVGNDRQLHGYGWVWDKVPDREMIGDIYIRPGSPREELYDALLARIEVRAAEHIAAAPAGDEVTLGLFGLSGSAYSAYLQARGYAITRTYFRMQIELGEERPVPPEIPGIDVRPFRPGQDDAALHRVIQESFAQHYLFAPEPLHEWIERRTQHPVTDPSLWRVAWDAREPVGGILPYPFEGLAWIREVGVRREWRARGVGRALLLHGFAALHERGHRKIGLGVDSENATGATKLYESAGMRVTLSHAFHKRVLRPGKPVSVGA